MNSLIPSSFFLEQLAVYVSAVMVSFFGTLLYCRFALKRGIIAKITFRSLHDKLVPRGGGIVFACVFSGAILLGWLLGRLPATIMLAFGLGGAAAALFGFIDDRYEIRASKKLILQAGLGLWSFLIFYPPLYSVLLQGLGLWIGIATVLVILFASVWFINLYNFIDGIDGLAISGAVYICAAAVTLLWMSGGDEVFIFVFALLAACGLGFMFLNLPPARVFMGDSGSIFLGYGLGTLLITTTLSGQLSIWTWLCILSYFVGDTSTTGIYRLFLVKKWYGVHRSHAYQNLARIYNSHALVTYGVLLYNVVWTFPLALWSVRHPEKGPIAATLSLGPVILWTIRFGPRLSSG